MNQDTVTFFDGLAADAWANARTAEASAAEAAYVASRLALDGPGRLLDVPCGDGRLSRALASMGHAVTGLDGADTMIRRAAAAPADGCTWQVATMEDLDDALDAEARYDGAVCFGNAIGYLDAVDTAAFFAAVARRLEPGARFVIETEMTAESVLPNFADKLWQQVGDILMVVEHNYDAAASRLQTDYLFIRDGLSEQRRLDHHVFTCGALNEMLAASGFDVIAMEADLDGSPFALADHRLLLTAVRR